MNARSGIVAGGNWIVDKVKFVDVYPQQDALANIHSEAVSNGGAPFNVLMDLARIGVSFPLEAVGLVGDDAEGRWILRECEQAGIRHHQLRTHERAPTSYTDVMTVRTSGRRTFFHQRGANAFLDVDQFDFRHTHCRMFHLGYLLLLDQLDAPDAEFGTSAARVLAHATEAGLMTSFDVVSEDSHRFSSIVLPALRHVDVAILNEFELERTTGLAVTEDGIVRPAAVRVACEQLLKTGVRGWVVVHFPAGACALSAGGEWCESGSVRIADEHIVSTVGAGDAFAAGVLFSLHEGEPMEVALRTAACMAAACLRGSGTSNGILPLAGTLALGNEFGFR